MTRWDEQQLRKEASWQAFKEGRSLQENSRVQSLKVHGEIATASFRQGKRALRTVVRVGSNLEVECQCPANRATGEVCAHGVAVILAVIEGAAESENQTAQKEGPRGENIACRVVFPPGFQNGLEKGRLSVRVERIGQGENAQDAVLSQWLATYSPGDDFPKLISVSGADAALLLNALRGHSRLVTGEGEAFTIAEDVMPPVFLEGSALVGDRVQLRVGQAPVPVIWGERLGFLDGNVLGLAPVESPSPGWRDEAAELLRVGSLDMSLDSFLCEIDAWMDLFQSPHAGWLGDLRFRQRAAPVSLRVEGSLNALDVMLSEGGGVAGDSTMKRVTYVPEENTIYTLNRDALAGAGRRLESLGFSRQGGVYVLRDSDAVVSFLANDLDPLKHEWNVQTGERLQHVLKSLHVIRPEFDFGDGADGGSLYCELSFQTGGGKVIPRAKVLEMLRSGRDSVQTKSGARVVVSRQVREEIEPLMADLGIVRPEGRLQLNRAQQEALRMAAGDVTGTRERKVQAEQGCASLRDYQIVGADWMVDRFQNLGGALLADEMGLGKTIQTIAAMRHMRTGESTGPALVLVPTSLLGNWADELARFAPGFAVVTLHGANRDELRAQVPGADVVLTSYGTLVRDLAFHLRQNYGLLVADEASLLRNPDSETSRAVAKLNTTHRLALTGTPVENRLLDLWSVFRIVAPGYLGAKDEFLERYETTDRTRTKALRARISPYVLRRTKSEVAKDLPEKIETDHWLELDDESRALYREIAAAGIAHLERLEQEGQAAPARMMMLTTLLRLRQICLDRTLVGQQGEPLQGVKSEWLRQTLRNRFEEGSKTLVFSQFTSYLQKWSGLKEENLGKIYHLQGATRNRSELVRAFQEHDGPAVFFISLKAGGYGLNLAAADAVVHMDPWWNPAAEAQASDRAHRIGQSRPVTVHRLLIRDSVEERVRRLQAAKQHIIHHLSDQEVPSAWDDSDLRSLREAK